MIFKNGVIEYQFGVSIEWKDFFESIKGVAITLPDGSNYILQPYLEPIEIEKCPDDSYQAIDAQGSKALTEDDIDDRIEPYITVE